MHSETLRNRYRCPDEFLRFEISAGPLRDPHYFRFGSESLCYGRCLDSAGSVRPHSAQRDVLSDVRVKHGIVALPFDPDEVIDNLRLERYQRAASFRQRRLKQAYYWFRSFTNQRIRKSIQKFHARNWQDLAFPRWPLDTTVENICETLLLLSLKANGVEEIPFIWFWPRGASGCVVMTHDVETASGRDFCQEVMKIDHSFGIQASYEIVPEQRYTVTRDFLESIRTNGGEIVIQDLNHDGKLYDEKGEFLRRVEQIHKYAADYGAEGFRAAVLYRNPEWYDALRFAYDMSIPNVAHLDPQRGGCCTVTPYFVGATLELPVTTTQDYTLLHMLDDWSIELWKTQLELILEKNGLASFIVHPDYIIENRARTIYTELLTHLIHMRQKKNLWFVLPREVNAWWRTRSKMTLHRKGNSWQIEGEGADQASVAFARNRDGKLVYELAESSITVRFFSHDYSLTENKLSNDFS